MRRLSLALLSAALLGAAPLRATENFTPEQRFQIFESIHAALQKQAPAIKALYDLELAKTPRLSGTVVVEITVEPNGSVSHCRVLRSTLNAEYLESRLPIIVRATDFGRIASEALVFEYPFEFLPN